MKPECAYIFTSRDTGIISALIAWVSRRKGMRLADTPSHCGLMFDLKDGSTVYYESHLTVGFSGPWGIKRLTDWLSRDPDRWARRYPLDLNADQLDALYKACEHHRGRWPYAVGQLGQMWRWVRLGVPIKSSPDETVCSEAVSRLLYEATAQNIARETGRGGHDYVAPSDVQYWAERNAHPWILI